MDGTFRVIAGWLLVLFGASGLYAYILPHWRPKYQPNWTWVTVVIGNSLLIAATAGMEWMSAVPSGTTAIFIAVNVAGGAPIVLWQGAQWQERRGRNGTH